MSKNICNDCGYDLGDAYENCGMASDGVCPNCGRGQPEETKPDKEKFKSDEIKKLSDIKLMIARLIIDHVKDKSVLPVNPMFYVDPKDVVDLSTRVARFKEEVKKLYDQQLPAPEFSDLVERIYHDIFSPSPDGKILKKLDE